MSPSVRFKGLPVSEGTATGRLHVADTGTVTSATPEEVAAAFTAVAAERSSLADRLRKAGRNEEADIIGVGALIAADAALVGPAVAAVRDGRDAATAVRQAAEAQAAMLEALPTPELAERAGDVRQVGYAVLDHLGNGSAAERPDGEFILIRREVSPADLIELADAGLTGAVSVAGGASSHAAIIARGLGLPMVSGMDAAVLAAPAGQFCVLDANEGELIVGPSPAELAATAAPNGAIQRQPGPGGPARTADGRVIAVLCNVASAAETRRGLAEGAAGVGLLRTEIPYLQALTWPTLAEHLAQLTPILGLLDGKTATVRLLDFSGDKIPPFLSPGPPADPASRKPIDPASRGAVDPTGRKTADPAGRGAIDPTGRRTADPAAGRPADATADGAGSLGGAAGLAALLAHRTALADQLRAVLEAGRRTRLAVLVPMVSSLDEVSRVRDALTLAATAAGIPPPSLGIMVELQATAAAADTFAAAVDFFSIGTNDLTGQVLGLGRRDPSAKPSLAAHPQVLALISHVAEAGRRAGIPVSVCGDSAADPLVLPLLVGLGVDTLSVPAARVQRVRSWLADLDAAACAALAAQALRARTVEAAWKLVQPR